MIKDFLFVAAITCGTPEIINRSNTWDKEDEKTLQYAKLRCDSYTKGSRDSVYCLEKFIKDEDGWYQWVCANVGKKDVDTSKTMR